MPRIRKRRPSLYSRLQLPAEEIERMRVRSYPSAGVAVPGFIDQPGGEPLAGMAYTLDFCAEEEWGAAELRRSLTGGDRVFRIRQRGRVGIVSDACALILSTGDLDSIEPSWSDPLPGGRADHAERFTARAELTRAIRITGTVQELRARARDLGIRTRGLRKQEVCEAIAAHPRTVAESERPECWPGWFADGRTLVLRADQGPAAEVMEGLREAARAGRLGITNYQVPFGAGLFIYDTRDETREMVAERTARFAWHDQRMAELAPVMKELAARGHSWFFLGRPTESVRDGVRAVRYWLNGTGRRPDGRWGRQPFGWFTLEELLVEKFVADADARA